MYRDLFDKHKKRVAFISEDCKVLIVNYEFRSSAIPFNKEKLLEKKVVCFGGLANIKLTNNREFVFKLNLDKPNLNLLYRINLAIVYILGKNLHLQYYARNFPYYPVDKYFNLNSRSPISPRIFKNLMEKPEEVLSKIISHIENKNSYFAKFFPTLININSFPYPDIIFTVELGLLEKEASKKVKGIIEGKIFSRSSKEFTELKNFLDSVNKKLEKEHPNIINSEALKHKLSIKNINERGTTKEKIKAFLSSFSREDISECSQYVGTWWEMRKGIIVHGTTDEGLKVFNRNKHLADRLHRLLVDFLLLEHNNG